jgi:PKD repeat protein
MFYSQISVNDAAREAALEASRNPTSFIPNTACTAANRESNRVMCRATNEARGGFVAITPADVAMACSTMPCPAAPALGQTVSVTVTGHFRLITPLLAVFFGGQDTTFASTSSAQLLSVPVTAAVAGPVASFTAAPITGTAPVVVTVTDTSTGTPTAWGWGFGDGSTFVGRTPPAHSYPASGTFTITLTVSNTNGTSTATQTVTVTPALPAPPVASFNYSPTTGPVPISVTATDTSTGTPTGWSWTFGDSTPVVSVQNPPAHQYAVAGVYTITLTVTNAGGSSTITHDVTANIVCPVPISSFTVSPTSGVKNTTQFDTTNFSTNMSTPGCNNIWSWNFGDGTGISSAQSPANHIYTKKGDYTIELTASNLGGTSTSTRSVTVSN